MTKKAKKRKTKIRSTSGSTGRDSKGLFVKGNRCSIGNVGKSSEHAKELKKAFLSVVTEEDITAIVKKMVSQAKEGDNYARKELFDRLWGRALQEVDLGEETRKTMFDILAVCGIGNDNGDKTRKANSGKVE